MSQKEAKRAQILEQMTAVVRRPAGGVEPRRVGCAEKWKPAINRAKQTSLLGANSFVFCGMGADLS